MKFENEELRQAVKNEWVADRISAEAFYGHISGWDVSEVTDMSKLFKDVKDFTDDISEWDVLNVSKMRGMFSGASSFNKDYVKSWLCRGRGKKLNNEELKQAVLDWREDSISAEVFHGHISDWDVSEVTDMSELFKDAKSFEEDMSGWDVSNVGNMQHMFRGASTFDKYHVRYWTCRGRNIQFTNEE